MTQDDRPLSRLALFGKTHELWPVAALLVECLPAHIRLLIFEDETAPAESAALTIASNHRFHRRLGIAAEDLVLRCNGTLGLGVDCRGWQGDGSRFFAARSGLLPRINGVALHHIMLRAALAYDEPERLAHLFEPFRFAARAALAGKLADHVDDPESPLRMLGPTVQFDRTALAALLKERCRAAGVQPFTARPIGIALRPESHAIASFALDNGEAIEADLFIDVSGELARLAGDDGQTAFISLADLLPFDRIVGGPGAGPGDADNRHTIARAALGGLFVETPLGTGRCVELLFRSDIIDDEAARRLVGGGPPSLAFSAGHVARPWTGNLIRMGGAAGRFGPYQSADMLMVYEQALRFSDCIPASTRMDIEATEYNRNQAGAVEEIRDFAVLPCVLNGRSDAPWAAIGEARPPESLQFRLDRFASRGRFTAYEDELFDQQTWIDMLIGFGVVPQRYDPMAQSLDMQRLAPILKEMVAAFTATIVAMPTHARHYDNFLTTARTRSS